MTHVLAVTAVELGHPIVVLIEMKAGDFSNQDFPI